MEFAEDRLVPVDAAPPELEALVANARRDRPEIGQLRHGKAAIAAWEEAESKARLPVLFLALQGAVDWSPMRPKGYSALAVNAYNDYFIGVAVGARLDLDLGLADARVREAQAKAEWLRANEQVADTGIPVQVFKARQAGKHGGKVGAGSTTPARCRCPRSEPSVTSVARRPFALP